MVGAAARAISIPARVDPVNETMSIPGCAAIAAPTPGPSPLTRLNTPGGTPASCRTCANSIALTAEYSLGFSTIVQPAASAGAIFTTIWLIGQFQGVIRPQTPIGSRRIRVVPRSSSKAKRSITAMSALRCAGPRAACPLRAKPMGEPISCRIVSAKVSNRSSNSARIRRSSATRAAGAVSEKAGKAARAARTARSTSSALPSARVPNAVSVAGSISGNGRAATGSTQAPSM